MADSQRLVDECYASFVDPHSNRRVLLQLLDGEAFAGNLPGLAQYVHCDQVRKKNVMAPSLGSAARSIWKTLSSIKTGVVLIILVVIFAAAGTVILQRPMTEPDEMRAPTPRPCCASSMPPASPTSITRPGSWASC